LFQSHLKVLISHVYSKDNKGDAALLAALIADVKRAFGNADLVALTVDAIEPSESFEGVPMRASFMYYALNSTSFRPFKLISSALIVTSTLAWACGARMRLHLPISARLKSLCQLYRDADMVVAVGGGYLGGKRGLVSTVNLILLVHPISLAAILRTPTVLYTQSIGPFGNRAQRLLVRHALNAVDMVLVREDTSMRIVSEMKVHSEVVRSVDGAFAPPDATWRQADECIERLKDRKPLVGITVRAWLAGERQTAFEKSVAELGDYLVSAGYYVVFIPQVTSVHHHDDDREVAARVRAFMRADAMVEVLTEDLDYVTVRKLCASVDYLIGTRFHSVIFALSGCVPACAIEYEHKTSGIMRDLGLEKWVIRMEDVSASRLIAMMKELIATRAEYESHLSSIIPAYVRIAAGAYENLLAVGKKRGLVRD
jgi:colanic acid/amylovoran biosynthesis protein